MKISTITKGMGFKLADLFELVFNFIVFVISESGQSFFRNEKRSKKVRLFFALLIFLFPVILFLLLTPLIIELNIWIIYVVVFGIEVYFSYLTLKYTKGILMGFKD
ncbi:DUF983 domain-containing protein [Marinilactibacillus psychrotolerans]|uniref:DUF983 domain-containing protein n=2 Tax=Marinilactibacillus psychrotolerans TaxID=191770 RepID=A0A5R9C0E2_9LACT|nr:DUF983 domain-containing protein [Marinilactibacillus psychrotolerans]GEQ34131.1 hypothetical protein B795N_20130 [Marinilactibacillus psychrotolerans]